MSEGAALARDGGPQWRVRVSPGRGLRRWTDRRLAQAEVVTPSGDAYAVRIKRNWPIVGSPLGPLDSFAPTYLSLGALLAANAFARGRTGWTVEVMRPATSWRSERVLHSRRSRDHQHVVALATSVADAIAAGHEPSVLDDDLSFRDSIKQLMHWD